MNRKEAIKIIRKAKKVFAYVRISADMGWYMQVNKRDFIQDLKSLEVSEDENIFEEPIELRQSGNLYI